MKHVRSWHASLGPENCVKNKTRLRQRRPIKTEHYPSEWTVEMHHVRWKTPGACRLPRGELKQRTGQGQQVDAKALQNLPSRQMLFLL